MLKRDESTRSVNVRFAYLQTYCAHVWLHILPITNVLRYYKWKHWLLADFLGGLSSGVMQVPQGMGFAAMIGLPVHFGLYTSFFPAIIYSIFGSSRHVSVGAVGIITGMITRIVAKHFQDCRVVSTLTGADDYFCSNSSNSSLPTRDVNDNFGTNTSDSDPYLVITISNEKQKVIIGIVTAMQFTVGMLFIAMSIFRMGFLGRFISHPFNSGIQTGMVFLLIVSQIAPALGFQSVGFYGVWNLPKQLSLIFQNLYHTNAADAIVGLITITAVLILREFVNVKFAKKLKHPIPAELIVMAIGTIVSHFAELNKHFGLVVTGNTPRGFLVPTVPILAINLENRFMFTAQTQFQLKYDFVFDCLALAVAIYGVTLTLSKTLARKHGYVIDENQELFAYGIGHCFSSFFFCFPVSQSTSRTMVMETNGAKSQLAGLVSAIFVCIVIFTVGPLFHSLPRALLAGVTFTAVCPVLRNVLDLRFYWTANKWDIIVWLVTFISTLLLDPFIAIAVGIGTNLVTMSLNVALASAESLSLAENTEIFINEKMYGRVTKFKNVKIFRFNGNICFLNVDKFKTQLFRLTVHPHEVQCLQQKLQNVVRSNFVQNEQVNEVGINRAFDFVSRRGLNEADTKIQVEEGDAWQRNYHEVDYAQMKKDILSIRSVIIDCSRISFVDNNGVMCLQQLLEDYKAADINLLLANCSAPLLTTLDRPEFKAVLYPSVFDALVVSLQSLVDSSG